MPPPRRSRSPRLKRLFLLLLLPLVAALVACGASPKAGGESEFTAPSPTPGLGIVGEPQKRSGIGDVDAAFARYQDTRADLIDLYKQQPWFKDGLSRDESLFVERGLTFVARYSGPRTAYVSEATIRDRLYKYDRLKLREREIEVLLIYEPGQDADREMS
jgi:hypothetical protein